jgi:DNA-binding transcriptional LysR family regulator
MRLPDLEAMAIFAKVVENRGIAAAASDLGLSSPTVSKALSRLEQRLGAALFNRTSRRMSLTDAGRDLAERAGRLLADAEAAEAALRERSATPTGTVRLTAPMSFGLSQVAPALPDFMRMYPGVTIDLHLSDALADVIGEGFDLALRIGELPDSSLRARRLAPMPVMVVAAPSYLDRRGRPAHPAELTAHDCFGYAYQPSRGLWRFESAAGEVVSVRPSGPLRVNNGEAALPAVVAGLGIIVVPAIFVRDALADGRLEQILDGWVVSRAALYLLSPSGGPRPARVGVLAEFLAERLAAG